MEQVNYFAIFVLLVALVMLIYLIAVGVYLWYMTNSRPITRTESTVLFWATVVMGILIIIVGIWAAIRIFTTPVVVAPIAPVAPILPVVAPAVSVAPIPAPVAPVTSVVAAPVGHTPIQIVATHS